ncbi:unnamed protein product [Staurois parvus]|uniref:Uncharacterized protein n=1 Tax=Staurois parvus TaxID=386267 RepID=A0ABN9BUB7_9NEOB|nr:unnamed protein product [Staurois parvus]
MAGDSPLAPGDRRVSLMGDRSVSHCFLLFCIAEQYKAMCLHSTTHTYTIV